MRERGVRAPLRCPFCTRAWVQAPTELDGDEFRIVACQACHVVRLERDQLRLIQVQARSPEREAFRRAEARKKAWLMSLIHSLEKT